MPLKFIYLNSSPAVAVMEMIVMLMNKDNNKEQYFKVKKQTRNQCKSACPCILNVKRSNIYTHINKLTHKLE